MVMVLNNLNGPVIPLQLKKVFLLLPVLVKRMYVLLILLQMEKMFYQHDHSQPNARTKLQEETIHKVLMSLQLLKILDILMKTGVEKVETLALTTSKVEVKEIQQEQATEVFQKGQ